jgi:hypothetical protein
MTAQKMAFLAKDSMVTGEPRWSQHDWDSEAPGTFLAFLEVSDGPAPVHAPMRWELEPEPEAVRLGAARGLRQD